ncbi:MAG: hypothetical protein IT260_08170 [Saprospiraceae bacterium]|nr:hypothetical protein [Saprospiraceae bacterium]
MKQIPSGYALGYRILAFLLCASPLLLNAQVQATFFDINPNNSSLDAADPDGASGGRVNGLGRAADGSAYYAASEWGGIYRSNDTGRNWFRLNGHRPSVTWDVEVDPSNSNRIYATSFYDGRINSLAGINVSNDGGTTWTHPATATPPAAPYTSTARRQEPSAFGIAIDPANTNNVYIGTNTGLAISNNAGATWRYVDPTPADPADNVWDVVVHHGGIIDIVGDDGHSRSTDGGTTWTTATTASTLPSGRASIAVSPDEAYVLFAVVGTTLFQTTDAGANWTGMTNPSPQGRIPFVATNQRAGQGFDLWFGDVGLWRTTCTTPASPAFGGAARAPANAWTGSFTRSAGGHDDCADILFDPAAATDACPVLFSSDGGVYFNTLNGAGCQSPVWEQPTVTPHGLWPFAMSGAIRAGEDPEDLYFGNQDNGSFSSTNAGANTPGWTNRDCCDGFDFSSDNNRALYTICCFSPAPANRLFLRNPGLAGGAEINTYPPGGLRGFAFDDILDQFGPDDYAVVTNTGLFITTNITASPVVWSAELGAATSPASICNIKASDNSGTPVFYGQSSAVSCDDRNPNPKQLWRFTGTAPAGTWQQINTPGGTGGFGVYDVDPNNSNRIFASHLRPGNNPQMLLSTDGGATWQNMPELDRLMTGNGVFRAQTTIGPSNFTGFQGYPQPSFVAFDPLESRILVAGAADAGVFVSNDGGVCWTLISDPFNSHISGIPHIPRPKFAYFSHQPDQAGKKIVHLYIGSQGRGVWRTELTIDGFPSTSLSGVVTPPNCPGGCDGSINLTPSGGQAPYSFRWSNGQTSEDASGLCQGTYTVTVSDQLGCVTRTFSVPDGVDVTPPVITCPPPITISCEVPPIPATTGNPVVTDNCQVAGTSFADIRIPGSCPGNFTINRTWRAVDASSNTATCLQVIKVQDIKAPVVTCPPNITVTCNTTPDSTGVATALDNCDPSPVLSFADGVPTGDCDWFCTFQRTWTAVDNCNNVGTCAQVITKNTLPLIEQALNADVDGDGRPDLLVVGVSNSTLTIPPGRGICIIQWMPSLGAVPSGIKFGKPVVGADCLPGTNPLDGAGKLVNPLLAEALKLNIMMRLYPTLATRKINTFGCSIAPIIIQALAPDADVKELLRVTNAALGNIALQPHLTELLAALQCINAPLDVCTPP